MDLKIEDLIGRKLVTNNSTEYTIVEGSSFPLTVRLEFIDSRGKKNNISYESSMLIRSIENRAFKLIDSIEDDIHHLDLLLDKQLKRLVE